MHDKRRDLLRSGSWFGQQIRCILEFFDDDYKLALEVALSRRRNVRQLSLLLRYDSYASFPSGFHVVVTSPHTSVQVDLQTLHDAMIERQALHDAMMDSNPSPGPGLVSLLRLLSRDVQPEDFIIEVDLKQVWLDALRAMKSITADGDIVVVMNLYCYAGRLFEYRGSSSGSSSNEEDDYPRADFNREGSVFEIFDGEVWLTICDELSNDIVASVQVCNL